MSPPPDEESHSQLILQEGAVQKSLGIDVPEDEVWFWWLGQAGFLLRQGRRSLIIDPYLSDYLAKKYAGKELPHRRMMSAPVLPQPLTRIDAVFCTHGHSDHLDPETLPVLAQMNPAARFVVPRAVHNKAVERGVPPGRMITTDAGERLQLGEEISVQAIPAAHEALETNEAGEHVYLGYIVELGGYRLYHSGDTVLFQDLSAWVCGNSIDVMLLPVNGRDEYRRARGVPGNMTLEEAVSFARTCGVRNMIGHHIDLFEFNTISRAEGEAYLSNVSADNECLRLVETGVRYRLTHR